MVPWQQLRLSWSVLRAGSRASALAFGQVLELKLKKHSGDSWPRGHGRTAFLGDEDVLQRKHDQAPGMLRRCWSGGTAGNRTRPWRCPGGFGQRHSVKLAMPGTGSQLPVIFLGTFNQTNKRNWATAAVGVAHSYRFLSLSLLLWNLFYLLFSMSLQTWSSLALKRSSGPSPLQKSSVGNSNGTDAQGKTCFILSVKLGCNPIRLSFWKMLRLIGYFEMRDEKFLKGIILCF